MAQTLTFSRFLRFSHILYRNVHSTSNAISFVPEHTPVTSDDIRLVNDFIANSKTIVVLTGAGISTESGIPDYRSAGVGLYARSSSRPVQYQDFVKKVLIRKRYWARNYAGWPRFSMVRPNRTHFALQKLEMINKISAIVTQNVDELHQKAGSKSVIELHGTAYKVICLQCDYQISRHDFQTVLQRYNPTLLLTSTFLRPDGDVELPQDHMDNFQVPSCPNCDGILKPDIIFFGDNVPKQRVEFVYSRLEVSDALLAIGTSLAVFSGYRFILRATEIKIPIAIINIGETRGDKHACIKIEKQCGDLMSQIFK